MIMEKITLIIDLEQPLENIWKNINVNEEAILDVLSALGSLLKWIWAILPFEKCMLIYVKNV